MRVLMFGWEFPPHISGGLGTACYGLVKGLNTHGAEVVFVMPSASGDEDASVAKIINASDVEVIDRTNISELDFNNVEFIRVDSNLIPYVGPEIFEEVVSESVATVKNREVERIGRIKYNFSGKYGVDLMDEVVRYAMVAEEIAANNTFDIIHAHDWLTYLAGIRAKMISGKPLVIHVHATEFDRSGSSVNSKVFDLEKLGMIHADKVVTVSHLTENIVVTKYGIDPSKVVTLHNAVDFGEYQQIENDRSVKEKVVTFLGRITYQKGPEYFIEAAYKVLQKSPDVRFVMAGSGDLLNRSIRRVAKLGIADRFHFTGFLKGDDVKKMFAYSDVYVMPSVSEPFGISPLEAMKSNVPTIISKQSGVAEVLNHVIKVDFWDIDALADSIYALLNYPAISAMTSVHGMEEVNALKWDNAAKRLLQIYDDVLSTSKLTGKLSADVSQ